MYIYIKKGNAGVSYLQCTWGTVYSVQCTSTCTVYIVQSAVYSVHCTVYIDIVQCVCIV